MKTIFVSSTFSDMQLERNLLHSKIMPEVNSNLQKNGNIAQILDFRWGVNTEYLNEHDSMKKVLLTCFDGISNSNYAIVFIGDHYGTSVPIPVIKNIYQKYDIEPSDSEKSITELEIDFALKKSTITNNNILFYLKNSENTKNTDFRIIKLKKRIAELYPNRIRYYDNDLENNSMCFIDALVKDITDMINKDSSIFPPVTERLSHNYSLHWSSRYNLMNSAQKSIFLNRITVISGPSGCGKTVFISALREKIKNDAHTCIEFISKTSYTAANIKNAIWNYLGPLLMNYYGIKLTSKCFGNDFDETIEEMCKLFKSITNKKPFFVFIDGIDKIFQIDELTKLIRFIHRYQLDINFVISCSNPSKYVISKSAKHIYLDFLSESDKRKVVSRELSLCSKSLNNETITYLLNKKDSVFPLYINIAIKRLVLIQEHEYKKINEEVSKIALIHTQRTKTDYSAIMNQYILEIIKNLPENIENLIINYIEFASKAIDETTVALNASAFMASSFLGYTDVELVLLIKEMGFLTDLGNHHHIKQILILPFISEFNECDLYWFRKYIGNIVYQNHMCKNSFENTIIKEAIYRLYKCNIFCDKKISRLFLLPHKDRVISDIEIAGASFRSYDFKTVFAIVANLDKYNEENTVYLITKLFVDSYLENPNKYIDNFFNYARKNINHDSIECIRCCLTKILSSIINSSLDPILFVSFFEKCVSFLRSKMDYSKIKTRLFLSMARFNIAVMLKNGGYINDAKKIATEVFNKMKAIPIKLRNELYYEALETLEKFIIDLKEFY